MKQQLQNPNDSHKRRTHFLASCSSGKHSGYFFPLLLIVILFSKQVNAQGVWYPVASQAPHLNAGVSLLLSDGSVMAVGALNAVGNNWDRLTPDSLGSYINGTWTSMPDMSDERLYFSSQVLMDGRVYVAGGEYGSGGTFAETYDPLTDIWTPAQPTGFYYSDANSEILPDGRVLQAIVGGGAHGTIIYNPAGNNWNFSPPTHGSHNESTWVKLRDSSVLMVDMPTTNSERYIPSLNEWLVDATVPVELYDPYGSETGPAFLLPDGRAFFIGAPSVTAYYTPSGDTTDGFWEAGSIIPSGQGAPDAAGAMMVNGKILCALSPAPSLFGGVFQSPTSYYEFDYLTNSFVRILAPTGDSTVDEPCYFSGMLDLPDGTVLYSDQYSSQYYVYVPDGGPLPEWRPTISNIVQDQCGLFTITGTQFNGITEGASFGDDWQMNTNYPIIRLTSDAGHVYYARTFNWNSTGVQRGSLPDTTHFTLPAGLPPGIYWLVVTANGISSDSIKFIPFPILSSTLTPPPICSNTLFSYSPSSFDSTATFTWTREAVAGISNNAVTVPQVTDPNEILINTTSAPVSVIYEYTIAANGCVDTQNVTVLVYPSPSASIDGPSEVCQGDSITLTATGGPGYIWSNGDTIASITALLNTTTAYSVIVTNSNACTATDTLVVIVHLLPDVDFAGLPDTMCSYAEGVALTGNPGGGVFNGSGMTGSVFNPSSAALGNDTITYLYTDSHGCENSAIHVVYVTPCTGIAEAGYVNNKDMLVYPNPADHMVRVAFRTIDGGSYSLRLRDMLGTTMRHEIDMAKAGDNSHLIDLDGIPYGVYMVILQKGNDVYKTLLVVQ